MKKYFLVFFLLLSAAGFIQAQDSVWVPIFQTRCDGNVVESQLYYSGSNGQQAGSGWKYADNDRMVEYHLDLNWFKSYAANHTLYFRAYMWNEYYIKASEVPMSSRLNGVPFGFYEPNGDTSVTMRDGSNGGWHEIDLTEFLDFEDFYVAFFDGRPQDGWGPSIAYIAVAYKEDVSKLPQQLVDVTFTKSEHYTIDGNFNDWLPENQWVSLTKGGENIVESGTVGAGFTGTASIAYDDTTLYVGAQVTDATVTDNDKVILYLGNYWTWEGKSAGHSPLNDGAISGYRNLREPDYKIEIPLKDGEFMKETKLLLTDTLVGNFKVVKEAGSYKVEAQIPFSSLYKQGVVSTKFKLYPSPVPAVYATPDQNLPSQPFAFSLVDGDGTGFKGSLTTAFAADADENPSSWALVTNTLDKFPFEHFKKGPKPPEGNALLFNSEDRTAVTVPNPGIMLDTTTGLLTMEAWINAPEWRGSPYQGCVINRENDATYTLRVGGTGQINANIQKPGGDVQTPSATKGATMELNTWYHIAVVVDEDASKIYVNGELAQTDSAYFFLTDPAQGIDTTQENYLDLVFGTSQAYSDRAFTGYIDEVRMWSVPRTQEQIVDAMSRTLTETECQNPELIGYWPMDEGEGQLVADKSSYGRDGYLGLGDSVETTDPVWNVIGVEPETSTPQSFNLAQNYPNPFNPVTTIKYSIPSQGFVKLNVYNILGQEVKTLVNEVMGAGNHQITWKGDNNFGQKLSSGVYFYRIDFNGSQQMVKKMVFLK